MLLDVDKNGEIDNEEVSPLFDILGYSKDQKDSILELIDWDKKGYIT